MANSPSAEKKVRKNQKIVEPQFYVSATNLPTYNYKVYHMSLLEKAFYFIVAFVVGAFVGYLFYGGIGKDEFGNPTILTRILDVLISSSVGIAAGIALIPIRTEQIIKSRKSKLNTQFRDMLEAFTTSLGAGKNVTDSFYAVYEDMKIQYDEDAAILKELEIIISGIQNNINVEDLLLDFGARSGLDDIQSFANVFKICYRKGGNIRDVIRNTHSILKEKMEINEDIETVVAANKSEQNLMLVMPIALIGMIKMISEDFAGNFVTPAGIIATTIGVAIFVASYYVGKSILDIKV